MDNLSLFRSFVFLYLVIWVSFTAFSQSAANEFRSGEGGFFMSLPETPTERKTVSVQLGKFSLEGESITWRDEAGNFTSAEHYYVERNRIDLTAAEKSVILQNYKKSVVEQFRKKNISTFERPFVFGKTNGVEIRGTAPARFVVRTFFGKNRLFSISSVRSTVSIEEQIELLGTFRILSKPERTRALIIENTPPPFEKSAKATDWENDLKSERIIGKVSEIVTEYQEGPKAPRIPWSDERFDSDGNLIFQVAYHAGFPDSISTMGWLDGARAYRSNTVSFPLGEGPNEKMITMITEAPAPAPAGQEGKTDDRFDVRYERTYGPNKLLQTETVMDNSGMVTTRKTFTYGTNRRDIVYKMGNGAFYNRTVEILGSDGHVIEERSCNEQEKNCSVTVYKYEFDVKGNWVVRRDFERKTVKRNKVLSPTGVLYRKIEYSEA